MSEKRLKKKREKDRVIHMTIDRINKRRRNQKIGKKYKTSNSSQNLKYINFGRMDYECPHCSALFWSVEFSFKSCCHNGKIKMPPLLLYDSKFRNLIRYYNSTFSFVSFNDNVRNEFEKGVYNLKVQGKVCHTIPNSLISKKGESPVLGQIYIYEYIDATNERLKNNKKLVKSHIKILTKILMF